MKRIRALGAAVMMAAMAGCVAMVDTPPGNPIASQMAGVSVVRGSALEKEIAKAEMEPLGSRLNPVRVHMPEGQRAYLNLLRCENGRKPAYRRAGSAGDSRYGNIMDLYIVTCEGSAPARTEVFMDMYHRGSFEKRPVPGFTMGEA